MPVQPPRDPFMQAELDEIFAQNFNVTQEQFGAESYEEILQQAFGSDI